MLFRTVGFVLACIPATFIVVTLAGSQPDAVPIVLIPILIAAFPLLAARTRIARFAAWLSGLALLAFSLIGGFSIGMFYFPAALAVLAAGFQPAPVDTPPAPIPDNEFWAQRGNKL